MILKGKTTLVTGGSRGIGLAVAQKFIGEGAGVMLAARSLEELKGAKRRLGQGTEICEADVSKPSEVENLIEKTVERFGRIDVVVNAAGVYGPIGSSEGIDLGKWKQTFEINVFGTFSVAQRVLPIMMKERKGKIINFSGGGDGPFPRFSAYSASKVAIVRLTETLAAEFKEFNIDINVIAPGAVNTHILEEALSAGEEAVGKEKYREFLKQKETGGVSPEKAADLCVFLASPASDGLTGRFLSAVWDDWRNWDNDKIKAIMSSDMGTLRRVKPK